ncbi:MAG: phospholipase B family protein [Desulfosudis oleivorans]|nr:phospholipase B family protein [Desulfosudis oleivorans]
MPGAIHSGDDFVVNGAGLVYTETTMGTFKGFREEGAPEFMRARKAAQYAASIDDFVRIMGDDNNGAYANDWLVGDTKTGEIAKFELGLKNQKLWRTTDGYFVGSNFPGDEKVIAEETTFDPADTGQSVLVRKARWEQLMEEYKGYIDVEDGKLFEADHVDMATGKTGANSNVLCGHVDEDPKGTPEFSWAPFSPGRFGPGQSDLEHARQRDEDVGPHGPSLRAGLRGQGFPGQAPRVLLAEALSQGPQAPSPGPCSRLIDETGTRVNLSEFISQIRWRPRIGDPSVMGWLTVAGYAAAAALCFMIAYRARAGVGSRPGSTPAAPLAGRIAADGVPVRQ